MSVLVITGTDTGVGKTIATAALACHARQVGIEVSVCKPVQTGTAHGDDDLAEVGRLSGITTLIAGARYPQALAPAAAAALAGMVLPTRDELLAVIQAVDQPGRLTLVEGAGGLLVTLAAGGVTLRDLARDLRAPVLVVVGVGLGTLNHTALTLEALAKQDISCSGLVIGSWPRQPGQVALSNVEVLGALAPIRATLAAGAGALGSAAFASMSAVAFATDWVTALAG